MIDLSEVFLYKVPRGFTRLKNYMCRIREDGIKYAVKVHTIVIAMEVDTLAIC